MTNLERPISDERRQQVLLPIDRASGLPNESYTDERCFRHERDVVLGRSWAALVFADAIPARPCAKPVEFMGLPLLVTRDRAGVLRVFHNVCSHRGIKLVAEQTEIRGLISCRYHAWSYAASGELMATPHIGGVDQHRCPGFSNAEHGLRQVRSAEFLGMLFVNLSGDAPDFDRHIAPLHDRVSALVGVRGWSELASGGPSGGMRLEVACNWKLAVENYCEAYHLPWVHPSLNSYSRLEDHYCFLDACDFAGQGSLAYRLSEVAGTHLPRFTDWPAERIHVAEYPSFYPNVLLGFQADHVFAVILTPLAPGQTREELRLFYVRDGATGESYAGCRQATQAAWRRVFDEDVFAVEGMQAGRASPAYHGGAFSPAMDAATHHFHRWVAERLAAQ